MILKKFFTAIYAEEIQNNVAIKTSTEAGTATTGAVSVEKPEVSDELRALIEEDIKMHLSTETGLDRLRNVFVQELVYFVSASVCFKVNLLKYSIFFNVCSQY